MSGRSSPTLAANTRTAERSVGASTAESTLDRKVGTLVGGRYRLQSLLGQGSMGEVWKARHEELNIEVAVKFADLRDAASADRLLERFRFEAQVSAQLGTRTHCIVAAQDAGTHRGSPYLVMELVRGASLDALVTRHGALPLEVMVEVIEQIASALQVAHDNGIWHRDVKPANIMISGWDGGSLTSGEHGGVIAKLADFGVAKEIDRRLDVETPKATRVGMLVGSPAYMSPEQLLGERADHRGDLWSLAVSAYEALTGRIPFDGTDTRELMRRILSDEVPPPSTYDGPPELDAWFARALAKDPAQRFDSAHEMAKALRAAFDTVPPPPPPPPRATRTATGVSSGERLVRQRQPLPMVWIAAGAGALAALTALVVTQVMTEPAAPAAASTAVATPEPKIVEVPVPVEREPETAPAAAAPSAEPRVQARGSERYELTEEPRHEPAAPSAAPAPEPPAPTSSAAEPVASAPPPAPQPAEPPPVVGPRHVPSSKTYDQSDTF